MASAVRILLTITIIFLCIIYYPELTPQKISAFVGRNQMSAPLLFVGLCAVRPLLFFLPSMGLTIVAGLLFGAAWGTVYVAIGGAISTAVGYYFARWMGRDAMQAMVAGNAVLARVETYAQGHSKNAVLYMRLFNLPWDIVSYWAGLHGIKFRDFYIASMIPLIPVSFLYTYFGSTVFDPLSAGFIISLTIIFLMGAIPYIRARWRRTPHG
ncbi:MAG TPA: VTT domain-containing protein [Dissulfurispiraceae bacterium]|nr:VTT domain-containing protein [Dissulfurispiraceae bacterium]